MCYVHGTGGCICATCVFRVCARVTNVTCVFVCYIPVTETRIYVRYVLDMLHACPYLLNITYVFKCCTRVTWCLCYRHVKCVHVTHVLHKHYIHVLHVTCVLLCCLYSHATYMLHVCSWITYMLHIYPCVLHTHYTCVYGLHTCYISVHVCYIHVTRVFMD